MSRRRVLIKKANPGGPSGYILSRQRDKVNDLRLSARGYEDMKIYEDDSEL